MWEETNTFVSIKFHKESVFFINTQKTINWKTINIYKIRLAISQIYATHVILLVVALNRISQFLLMVTESHIPQHTNRKLSKQI